MSLETKIAVYGCGNKLFGDDGFGPAVISLLKTHRLPDNILVEDVGTGIREILFDLLLAPELAPKKIVLVDAIDTDYLLPGEIVLIKPQKLPPLKQHDFSLHQFPAVNLLRELSENTHTEVTVVAAQVTKIPSRVCQGLSRQMSQAAKEACDVIINKILFHDLNVRKTDSRGRND